MQSAWLTTTRVASAVVFESPDAEDATAVPEAVLAWIVISI